LCLLLFVGMVLGGCATRPYRLDAAHAKSTTSTKIPQGASFQLISSEATSVKDRTDDRKLARQRDDRPAYRLLDALLSSTAGGDAKDERDAATLRTEVEKSLNWVGFRQESGEKNRAQYQVKASAVSSIQSYQAMEGVYEQRDTGRVQTICLGDFFSICTSSPVTVSVKTGERQVTKFYRRTQLVITWESGGLVAKSLVLSTNDESCDFERRMKILAGEGLRQALRNPTQQELSVRIPQSYCS